MSKTAARTLADVGEASLIERIRRRASAASERAGLDELGWILGIGDDAAILRPARGSDLVLSTDAQVEGVHFRFGRESSRTIGRRAMCVNLSDLAAMGARPVGALLSLAAPGALPLSDFDALIRGFVEEGARYACPLVGGNLSRAAKLSLHVTVVGRVPAARALRRGKLGVGDELFVTGMLGQAAIERIEADRTGGPLRRVPEPRLAAGRWLAGSKRTTGCIDLSDGLATDLANLLQGSGFGATIDAAQIPVTQRTRRGCAHMGLDPLEIAVTGGEDYELLFARRPGRARDPASGLSERLGVPVHRIGQVSARRGIRGLPVAARPHHF